MQSTSNDNKPEAQVLFYWIDVVVIKESKTLEVSGTVQCLSTTSFEMFPDNRFSYKTEGQKLLFSASIPYQKIDFMPEGLFVIQDFYPKPINDDFICDFSVGFTSSFQVSLATGVLKDGRYIERKVRSFALVFSNVFDLLEDQVADTQLRCLHYKENPDLAHTILDHAKQDIENAIHLFGFFPYRALIFVPGSVKWSGGCPLATGVIGLHYRPLDTELLGNNSIITHEICHEYWGEYVKDREPTGFLSLGLGLSTDYALNENRSLHEIDLDMYKAACKQGRRTAIDIPQVEYDSLMSLESLSEYDYNTAVLHGKSAVIMSLIRERIGVVPFFSALSALLMERAGRIIDRSHFLSAIKRVSDQDFSKELADWLSTDDCII